MVDPCALLPPRCQASRLAQKGAQSLLGQGRFLRITPHAQLVNGLGLVLKNPDFGPEGRLQTVSSDRQTRPEEACR